MRGVFDRRGFDKVNILVTGAKGFVGKNLTANLKNIREGKDKTREISQDINIFEYDLETPEEKLDDFCREADFVFNLAGVNRPQNEEEFMTGNFGFAEKLLNTLKKYNNKCPVMLSSSVQAEYDNAYGKSKKAGEDLFFRYSSETGARVLVYRFPNLFGKWCRANYNSVIATFCYNIARDLPITINDRNVKLRMAYIDDVVDELIRAVAGKENRIGEFCGVPVVHQISLGEIADLLYSFKKSREADLMPEMTANSFSKKLYATYLSYLEPDKFAYKLKMNTDARGSFTEILRTGTAGQFSVNISKPGMVKGQHWHNTKNEKFVVVSGHGLIQLRKIGTEEIINYEVNGEELTVVDMIPGYTHNIINLSDTEDLITFMWSSECFEASKPDTYFEEV